MILSSGAQQPRHLNVMTHGSNVSPMTVASNGSMVPVPYLCSSRRWVSNKSKKNRNKNKNQQHSNKGNRSIKFRFLESEYDEDARDLSASSMKDLYAKIAKASDNDVGMFEGDEPELNLQICSDADSDEWEPLTSLDQLKQYAADNTCGSPQIRIGEYFEGGPDYDYMPPPYGGGDDDESIHGFGIAETVAEVVQELKSVNGWTMHETRGLVDGDNHTAEVSDEKIREAVLEMARHNEKLQETLIGKIGALQHLIQCVRFPFVWTTSSHVAAEDDGEDY